MGRQCHVETRLNLNESAFGLITEFWERALQEVLVDVIFLILHWVTWTLLVVAAAYTENR